MPSVTKKLGFGPKAGRASGGRRRWLLLGVPTLFSWPTTLCRLIRFAFRLLLRLFHVLNKLLTRKMRFEARNSGEDYAPSRVITSPEDSQLTH